MRALRPGRRGRVSLWIACAALILLSALAGAGLARGTDLALILLLQRRASVPLDAVGGFFSNTGALEPTTVVALALVAYLALTDRRRLAARFALAFVVAGLVEVVLKTVLPVPPVPGRLVRAEDYAPLVALEPPHPFPSGHMLRATMLLGAVCLLTRRPAVLAASALLLAGMATSRVYMGVHWPSDVVGGFLLGGIALAWVFDGRERA